MNSYAIVKADVERDKKDILTILQRNLDTASSQRYDWNYVQCPYGIASCWLAKCEFSHTLTGSAALFPRKWFVNGKPTCAAVAGDFAIDKKHRGFGPAFKLQKEILSRARDAGFSFIYGVPNELSRAFFLRIGYIEIGKFKRYIKPIKTEKVSKEYLPQILQHKIVLKMADLVTSIISKEQRYTKNDKYAVEMPEYFDERFDALWKDISKQFIIIGERTAQFLNWRFKQPSAQRYDIFCIVDENKELAGYIVYCIKENICHVADMLFKSSEETIISLLAEFTRHIKTKDVGAIVIRYLGNELFQKKLKEFNFFMTKKDNAMVMLYDAGLPSESCLLDENNWHFFTGDSDV